MRQVEGKIRKSKRRRWKAPHEGKRESEKIDEKCESRGWRSPINQPTSTSTLAKFYKLPQTKWHMHGNRDWERERVWVSANDFHQLMLLVSRSHTNRNVNKRFVSKYNSIKLIAHYGCQRKTRGYLHKNKSDRQPNELHTCMHKQSHSNLAHSSLLNFSFESHSFACSLTRSLARPLANSLCHV